MAILNTNADLFGSLQSLLITDKLFSNGFLMRNVTVICKQSHMQELEALKCYAFRFPTRILQENICRMCEIRRGWKAQWDCRNVPAEQAVEAAALSA